MSFARVQMVRRLKSSQSRLAFSLVEVTLSLGIVGFALVGILGALPVAMTNGRQSIEQTRAAGIADSIFANIRAQSFSSVNLLDDGSGLGTNTNPVNLKTPNTSAIVFYAVFDDSGRFVDGKTRMRFFATQQEYLLQQSTGVVGSLYQVVARFNDQPGGFPQAALANQVELAVGQLGEQTYRDSQASDALLKYPYRFTTIIANRGQ